MLSRPCSAGWVAARGAAAAAATAWLAGRLLHRAELRIPGWQRQNFRHRTVRLDGGASAVAGAVAGALAGSPRTRGPALGLICAAALAGGYDDLLAPPREERSDKGWHGHLGALRAGRLSGGMVKVGLIGGASLLTAHAGAGSWRRAVPDAALIAGCANLINLFDLRPGRAAKLCLVAGLATSAGSAGSLGAAVAGTAAAVIPDDLAERTMLGDLGANTLGVLLGQRLVAAAPARRWAALGGVAVLTLASEKVSFSAVIARTPALRAMDELGRR